MTIRIARFITISSICCTALGIAACSSDKTATPTPTPDAGSGGATGSGGAVTDGATSGGSTSTGGTDSGTADAGGTISVSGVVVDITSGDAAKNFDGSQYPVISGVEICVYGDASIPCVKSDSTGKYELVGAPADKQFYLSYKKTGLVSYLFSVGPTNGAVTAPAMLMTTQAYSDSWITQSGGTVDATKGGILFGATTLGPSTSPFNEFFGTTEVFYLQGFKVTVSPAVTLGPIFTSATWAPDPALTESSAAGWGMMQAAPGDYTLTFTHPNATCGTAKAKVVAGFSTMYVGVLCTLTGDGGTPTDGGGTSDAGDGG